HGGFEDTETVVGPHQGRGEVAPHTARGPFCRDQKRRLSMRVFVATVMVVFSLSAWGCGSSTTDSGGTPVTPTPVPNPAPTPTPTIVTINVVGINGAQSFSPNPAT